MKSTFIPSQTRSIIFDFDYTLADPSPGVEDCVNFALTGLGLPEVSGRTIRPTIGLSLADTFQQLAGPAHTGRYDDFLRLFVARADEVMVDLTTLFEPVPPIIRWLQKQGFALGIVSMKYRAHIEPCLQRESLRTAFDVIIGGDDISRHKPDPEGLALALARMGSPPSNAIYIGDSVNDAETAKQAGMPFVAVLTGATTRDAFNGYDVYGILADLSKLPQWVAL